MKSLNMIFAWVAGVGLIGILGCSGSPKDRTFEATGGIALTVSPSSPEVNETITISVVEAERYRDFQWTAVQEGSASSSCSAEGSRLHCTFDIGGRVTATVSANDLNGGSSSGAVSFNVTDPGLPPNQPPRLIADISRNGTVVATFSSEPLYEGGSMNQPTGNYTLSFARSVDDHDAVSQIRFAVNFNNAGWVNVAINSVLTFPEAEVYSVALRATDTRNESSSRTFLAYIRCDPGVRPALNLTNAQIQVDPTGTRNFYTYAVTGGITGGGTEGYEYSWDFNGDRLYDQEFSASTSGLPAYNHEASPYTLYSGTRSVGLKVRDIECNYMAEKLFPRTFNIPRVSFNRNDPNVLDGIYDGAYYFLQADIRPTQTSTPLNEQSRVENVDVVVNHLKSAPANPMRVSCDYRKVNDDGDPTNGSPNAMFTIYGWNRYARLENSSSQGIGMRVTGIVDTFGIPGQPGSIDTSNAVIQWAKYYTDGGQDNYSPLEFNTTNCSLQLRVTSLGTSQSPCNSNPSFGYPVEIRGIFHCPDMSRGNTHLNVGEEFGAFYCEWARVDACVGGGGGGGGTPPTPR